MFRIHTPLFNAEGALPDVSGGFPADDFESALEQGMAQQVAEATGQPQKEQVSQPSDDLGGKDKAAEVAKEPLTGKDKLASKLGKVAEDEPEQVAETTEDDTPPGDQSPKAVSRWKQLRQIEDQYKSLEPKVREYEAQIAELKKATVPPELEAELAELRQHRDVFDLRNSPDYRKTVSEPLGRIEHEVTEISQEFGINDDALLEAMRDPVEWRRTIAIEKVLKAAEKSAREKAEEAGEEYAGIPAGVVNVLSNHANRVHQVWAKRDELEANAATLRQSKEAETSQKSQLSTAQQEAEWQKAADESRTILETNFNPMLKLMPANERAELQEAMKTAKISDDPTTRAAQAQSLELLAAMARAYSATRRELAEQKKLNNGLVAAKPGTKQNHGEPVKKVAPGADFDDFEDELAGAMRSQYA